MSNKITIAEGMEQELSGHRVKVTEATWRMNPQQHEPEQCAFFSILNLATGHKRDEQVFWGGSFLLGTDTYIVSHITPNSDGLGHNPVTGLVTLRKDE